MGRRTPEPRTLEVRAIRDRERTRNGNWYLPCDTSDGVAAFWGSDKNLDNIRSIEAGRVPFAVACDCISANWSSHDLWVPESSRIELHAPEESGVRLATMHRVKGLEFERVVMASMNEGLVPLSAAIAGTGDETARELAETEERSLVYVAATRAKKELLVLSYGTPSPYFGEM